MTAIIPRMGSVAKQVPSLTNSKVENFNSLKVAVRAENAIEDATRAACFHARDFPGLHKLTNPRAISMEHPWTNHTGSRQGIELSSLRFEDRSQLRREWKDPFLAVLGAADVKSHSGA